MPPKKNCCICLRRERSRFHPTKNYEQYFQCCFGPASEDRAGYICNTCKDAVNKHRNDRSLEYYYLLDSKGKTGRAGHRKIGGKRCPMAIRYEQINEMNDDIEREVQVPVVDLSLQEEIVSTTIDQSFFFGGIVNSQSESHSHVTHVMTSSPKATSKPVCVDLELSGHDHGQYCKRSKRVDDDDTSASFDNSENIEPPLPSPVTKRFKTDFHVNSRPTKNDISNYMIAKDLKSKRVSTINFLGLILPCSIMDNIISYLSMKDMFNLMKVQENFFISKLSRKNKELSKLQKIIDVSDNKPLSNDQHDLLRSLVSNRQNLSDDKDIFDIKNCSGRAMKLAVIPHTEIRSGVASKYTLKRRAKILEKLTQVVSSTPSASPSKQKADVHSQRVALVKRNISDYTEVAKDAGIKVVASFRRSTVLALRSIMPFRLWRLLKRTFRMETGVNLFGTEQQLQDELEEMSFEYDCGNFVGEDGKEISFVRVKNVKEVITQVVKDLRDSGNLCYLENLPDDTLWLHLSGDKGGKSTKLLLQVINTQGRHSIKKAKLLATFEGGKDSRYNIERAFGPIIDSLQEAATNIHELQLLMPQSTGQPRLSLPSELCDAEKDATTPPQVPQPASTITQSSAKVPKASFVPLKPLDLTNTVVSPDCKLCKSCLQQNQSAKVSKPSSTTNPHEVPEVGRLQDHKLSSTTITTALKDHSSTTTTTSTDLNNRPIQDPEPLGTTTGALRDSNRSSQDPEPSSATTCALKEAKTYKLCKVTGGGDWEWIARCAGLTGPNGKHFCFHCKVILDDTKKGKPHALHIIDTPTYREKTNGLPRVLPPDEDFLRTVNGIEDQHKKFVAAGEPLSKAMSFENCINRPLMKGVGTGGTMIDTYSCTPLHISLGIGLQILNIIENLVMELDNKILEKEGVWLPYAPLMENKKKLLHRLQILQNTIQDRTDSIDERKQQRDTMKRDNAHAFAKNGRRLVDKTVAARKIRNDYEVLAGEMETFVQDKKWLEKLLKEKQNELEATLKGLETIKGPFKERFDNLLHKLNLQRAAYHSGSLVGPDVYKLTRSQNISLFGKVFKPYKLNTSEGIHEFSDVKTMQKVLTLLSKFSQCYTLYTENRVLCRHEVEILVLRCSSFGCWFPVNFPEENLKRKFHMLTVEVPRQARRQLSVGMVTEQTIESIHPYCNHLDRMFASVREKSQKGKLVMRQQNIFSNTVLPWLK